MGTIIQRGDGSEMRSLLALAIILAIGIDLSNQALTVPRMRKRDLQSMWDEDVQQPDSLEEMLQEVMAKNDNEYDYQWDRYQESLSDKMKPTYQKRTKEWYTRLG